MNDFKRKILLAQTFQQLPNKVKKYIHTNYLCINPDEAITAYYTPSSIVVEYKNIILSIEV